jgi:hemoglobin
VSVPPGLTPSQPEFALDQIRACARFYSFGEPQPRGRDPMQTTETTTAPPREKSPYELMGGAAKVREIVDRFYDIMDTDPAAAPIRAMHAKDLGPMRDRLTAFLSGWLGGPPLYFQLPDRTCVVSAHRPFPIGEAERDQWMMCIRRAMEESGVDKDLRELLDKAFLRMCEAFRNR